MWSARPAHYLHGSILSTKITTEAAVPAEGWQTSPRLYGHCGLEEAVGRNLRKDFPRTREEFPCSSPTRVESTPLISMESYEYESANGGISGDTQLRVHNSSYWVVPQNPLPPLEEFDSVPEGTLPPFFVPEFLEHEEEPFHIEPLNMEWDRAYEREEQEMSELEAHKRLYLSLKRGDDVPGEFESVKESLRAHKRGCDVLSHVEEMTPAQRNHFSALARSSQVRLRKGRVRYADCKAPRALGPDEQHHILYFRGVPRRPRPVQYSPQQFLEWVKGESSHIYATKRGFVPVLCPAGSALLGGSVASRRETSALLAKVTISAMRWGTVKNEGVILRARDLSLSIGPITIASLDELRIYAAFFSKHKPAYKALESFLLGGATDTLRLEASLVQVFPPAVWPELLLAREAAHREKWAGTLLEGKTSRRARARLADQITPPPMPVRRWEHVEYEGNVPSGQSSNGVAYDAGRQFTRGVKDEVADVIPQVKATLVTSLMNCVLGIANMLQAQTPFHFVTILTQTLINDPFAYSHLQKLIPGAMHEGSAEPDDSWYARLAGLGFMSSMREFFGEVYAALIPSFLEVCAVYKGVSLRMHAQALAEWVASALQELFRRVSACLREGSLRPLLGVDAKRWVRHARGLKVYREQILATGNEKLLRDLISRDELPREFRYHMNHSDFISALDDMIAAGERIASVTTQLDRDFSFVQRSLEMLRSEVMIMAHDCHERLVPFCGLIFGPPGTGKTTQAELLTRALVTSECKDLQDVYRFRDENFRTMLRQHTTLVRMDDPDAIPAKPTPGFEDYAQFIQRIVNSAPYPVEQAGVEAKGKSFAKPVDVLITSNSRDLGACALLTAPSALWRRINLYITPTVKPEFQVGKGDHRVDPAKAVSGVSPCLWTVMEYAGAGDSGRDLALRVVRSNIEWDECARYYFERRREHLNSQSHLLAERESSCPECFFPITHCVCARPEGAAASRQQDSFGASLARISNYFDATTGIGLLVGAGALVAGAMQIAKAVSLAFQGREAGVEKDSWFRTSTFAVPALPTEPPCTWTEEELLRYVADARVEVVGTHETGQTMHGIIYKHGWVVFPTHCFGEGDTAEIRYRGGKFKVRLGSHDCRRLVITEVSVAYVSGLSMHNGVSKFFARNTTNAKRLGPAHLCTPTPHTFSSVNTAMQFSFPTWKYPHVTAPGDCGSVLVATGPGGAVRIFGMHMWGNPVMNEAQSIQLSAADIDPALQRVVPAMFEGDRVFFKRNFPKGELPDLGHYPPKSEIGVACTYYNTFVPTWGTSPAIGRTIKSAFKPTSFAPRVLTFMRERGIHDEYGPPEFRGQMVEGTYFSPYIHALRDTNLSNLDYLPYVDSYVRRICGHFGGPLSEAEAFRGVPGEFNSVNIKTSMGAPHYGAKTFHVSLDRSEISPELAQDIDALEQCLEGGCIPRIVAEATLKDEILKVGKIARVFCILPASFNIVCKKHFAPLKRAMMASFGDSECCVGVDMGSVAVEDIVQKILPFPYLYDMDCARIDKMWTPQCWDAVAMVIYRVTLISAGELAAWRAWALVMAMKEAIVNVKGDLFTPYWNLSGNDITVQLNSILLSLMMQHMRVTYGYEFEILTYGDDNILGSMTPLGATFAADFTRDTGFVLTDGRKRATPEAMTIAELTFLKRQFRYDRQLRRWMAPLSLSSIMKMLLYRGKSALSPLDHEAQLLEAAQRYLVLHGREVYDEWSQLLEECGAPPRDWHEFAAQYDTGVFTDWMDRSTVHDGSPSCLSPAKEGKPTIMDHKLDVTSNETIIDQVNGVDATVTVTTDAVADTTRIVGPGDMDQLTVRRAFSTYQQPPSYGLGEFPERWVLIATRTVSSADVPVTSAHLGYLYKSLLLNPAFAAKFKHFTYFRGDLELSGVWTVPGNASGTYVCTVRPIGHEVNKTPFQPAYCLGYESSQLLLAANSSNFHMELPYFSRNDASYLPSEDGDYEVYLTCLSPLRTAIPGGVTEGTLRLYVRLKTGYEFLLPRWEGKPKQQGKIGRTAGVVRDVAAKLSGVPLIGGIASAVDTGATLVGTIADWFGFSRENPPVQATLVHHRSVGNLMNVDLEEHMDVAGYSAENRISTDPSILGGPEEDILSFESLSARWTLVKTFAWTAGHEEDVTIASIPISPGYYLGNNEDGCLTFAGYCGMPFEFWRANTEVRIVIGASSLHRGALQVVHSAADAPPTGVDVVNQGLTAILDVTSATVYDIQVDYASASPALPLEYFSDAVPLVPIASCNGGLAIRVNNPLVSQNPVDLVNVAVFVRFRNVQFSVPRSFLRTYDEDGDSVNAWQIGVHFEGKAKDSDHTEPIKIPLLVTAQEDYPHDIVAGERISSLRAMAQKPSRLYSNTPNVFVGWGGMEFTPWFWNYTTTTAYMALAPFAFAAASERIKVLPETDTWVSIGVVNLKDFSTASTKAPETGAMTWTGATKGAEASIPYYFPARGRHRPRIGDATGLNQRMISVWTSGVKALTYYSLGPDIRVGPFSGLPRAKFSTGDRYFPAWPPA